MAIMWPNCDLFEWCRYAACAPHQSHTVILWCPLGTVLRTSYVFLSAPLTLAVLTKVTFCARGYGSGLEGQPLGPLPLSCYKRDI